MPDASRASDQMVDSLFDDISGVILAGGKSSRYGRNKALEKIDGISLIERVAGVMGSVFEHLIIITNTPDEYAFLNIPMHGDFIRGLGPIGGIYTGLSVIHNTSGFFVACDMPLLNQDLIRYMTNKRAGFDVVVPRINGMIETLHAVYAKGCIPAVKRLIASKEYQTIRMFSELSVCYVERDEIRRFDPGLESFVNINRPQELRRLNN
ncbi:Molybdenum cofactor guanylyltransferase [uncultured Desulfobacterium sp.]|uniref:Probable molybdenum cofactor guanylyltransferase n=1 Tax=uncultured Desulfobacterium sp. TaxID=201089 RepID=A0A445MUP9_9BACT|nr:Molybdenum cofactor guanylyltransferase [uncultured Desulfobacterium sp.]